MMQIASPTDTRRRRASTTLKLDTEARSILGKIADFEELDLKTTAKRVFKEAARRRKIEIVKEVSA